MRTARFFLSAITTLSGLLLYGEAVVRSPEELRTACRDNLRQKTFEISGTVILPAHFPYGSFFLQAGDRVLSFRDMRADRTVRAEAGKRITVTGRTEATPPDDETVANCYSLRVIGNSTLPSITPTPLRNFLSDTNANECLTAFRGIILDVFPDDIDAQYICTIFKGEEDTIHLICNGPRTWLPDFRRLIGCDVIVTGLASKSARCGPRSLGPSLRIAGTNAFQIVSRPKESAFDVPECDPENAANPRLLADLGPRRLCGTVLATWGQLSFLLKTQRGQSVCVNLVEGPLPDVHASVEAVGTVETDLCDLTLSRAFWRTSDLPPDKEEVPECVPLRDLFTTGYRRYAAINVRAHGKILSVQGQVKNIKQEDSGSSRILIADGDHTILVLCETRACTGLEEGSVISATGVCVKDSDVWRPAVPIPKIRGLFLVLRSPDDIVVLRKAPWWTPARFALVLTVLLAILVAVFIWNASLRILIERRSREVIKAQTAKIESELRIDERTRLAAELHDNTVQNLTAIAYRITAAQSALDGRDGDAGRLLGIAAKMLKSCRTNLRRCLWDLRSDALDESDFGTAIRRTVETVAGDAKLSVRFAGRRELISDTTAHALLNILRELVSNATVHGQADSLVIAGEARPGLIRFSVRDNGTGFDPSKRPGQDDGHFGLDGIQERLERLDGSFTVESSPGKGTYVRIEILKS